MSDRGEQLLELLGRQVVIADGAMGTQLLARGVAADRPLDALCLTQPELVLAVHYAYRAAGARVLETNTFGANRLNLARHEMADEVGAICAAGVKLARQAAGAEGWVLGSIGPIGRAGASFAGDPEAVRQAFAESAVALEGAGADAVLLESFANPRELRLAFEAVIPAVAVPVMVQVAVTDRLEPVEVDALLRVLLEAKQAGAASLGANCGFGPLHLVGALERLATLTDSPLSGQPNASFPHVVDGRYLFSDHLDYFVEAGERLVAAGVGLLGGCCGTTPEHIRALAGRFAGRELPRRAVTATLPPPPPPPALVSGPPAVPPLLARLGQEPAIIVELDPPRGMAYEQVLDGAERLAAAGVHGISIAENPLASIRMSSIALSHLVQCRAGIPAVCHLTCRDRNLLGQQSALMGASALGVETILALTGDPVNLGSLTEATGVFDTNSFGLIQMIQDFNQGRNALGQSLDRRTRFVVGVAFDPGAARLDAAVRRLEKKVALGVDFVMTQMIYDPNRVREMYAATAHLAPPVFAGFMPLVSARNARYLHNEVPGMRIPESVQERMAAVDGDRAASQAEGIALCAEWIDTALACGAPGIYLVTPFGRVAMMVELVEHIQRAVRAGRWRRHLAEAAGG